MVTEVYVVFLWHSYKKFQGFFKKVVIYVGVISVWGSYWVRLEEVK